MRRLKYLPLAALAVLVVTPWEAWGQFGSPTTTNSGTFGSRTMGRAMGGASRSFSGSGMGTGMGLGTGMGNGMGSGMGMSTNAFGNTQFRFNTRRQGEFVGADLQDINPGLLGGLSGTSGASTGRGGMNATGSIGSGSTLGTTSPFAASQMGRRSGYSGNSGRYDRRSGGAYGTGTGNQQMLLGLDMNFDVNVPPDPMLSSGVTLRLARSMRLPAGAPVEVAVRGGTAYLRGVVATAHDRALAEQLVLLEPGIARVANELQVEPNGATVGKAQATGNSQPAVLPPR